VGLLFCLLLAGCAQPKVQVIRWDALTARGYAASDPIAYSRVNIDLDEAGQAFQIRMPGGKILPTSAITLEMFSQGGPQKDDAQGARFFNVLFPALWRSGGGYTFEFENGRLVGLGIGVLNFQVPDEGRPAIGKSGATVLYTLPLTES